jgi:hypothetical protein
MAGRRRTRNICPQVCVFNKQEKLIIFYRNGVSIGTKPDPNGTFLLKTKGAYESSKMELL